jgi:hypothetical protein
MQKKSQLNDTQEKTKESHQAHTLNQDENINTETK